MAENSKISWTDHTFNPWMGCTKVSPGCKFCYAERDMDHRYGKVEWGPQGLRIRTAPANWRKPIKWNKDSWQECQACGWRGPISDTHVDCPVCDGEDLRPTRQRVFCASLADVFEYKKDQWVAMGQWRDDLFKMIDDTPNLDWLLLTKRPQNVMEMLPEHWQIKFPGNVWMGTSVESQEYADERIPELLRIPARICFLSCEPLVGPINLGSWIMPLLPGEINPFDPKDMPLVNWVIAGGESGPSARPMNPQWVTDLRDQCQASGVAFHFKQWGEWHYDGDVIKEHPNTPVTTASGWPMYRVGKHAAGRLVDGREWNEYPDVS